MGKFYKVCIDENDNIHVIINKKKVKENFISKEQIDHIKENVITAIIDEVNRYGMCVDERVSGIECLNAIRNIIINFRYR